MSKKAQDKEWLVPFRITLQGKVCVTAASAEAAENICEANDWDDPDFFNVAESTDWSVLGPAKEVSK